MNTRTLLASALVLALAGCSHQPAPASAPPTGAPADAFLANLAHHCGKAYAGQVKTSRPAGTDADFASQPLLMHVRDCSASEVQVPFHVGEDRSRTWILRRTADGLQLSHDHRLPDGSEDPVSPYGGHTAGPGSAARQEFPVDAASIALFEREGLDASVTNTWAMEIEPDSRFMYELARPGGRLLQVEFDLTSPVPVPDSRP